MSGPVAVGIDVGGTKLVAASVAADGRVLERRRVATPAPRDHDPETAGDRLVAVLADLADELGPELPLGIGIAAMVHDGHLVYAPNLAVRDLPLRERLAARRRAPVHVGNDASVAGWGEARVGAGRGAADLLMYTIGTGVGGAVVLDGRLVEGANGFAGELGHVVVAEGGRACPCGNHGCLEAYASGTAIGLRARELLAEDATPSSLRDVAHVDGKAVSAAAAAGDALARHVLLEAGHWLGIGAAGCVNAFDPDLVVVGGGAAPAAAPWLLPAAREAMQARLLGRGHRTPPPLEPALLGDDAGMIGAALLAADRAG